MRKNKSGLARELSQDARPEPSAERRGHRQSIGEDHRSRRAARLRWGQEGLRSQAAHPCRYGENRPQGVLKAKVHPADLHDKVGEDKSWIVRTEASGCTAAVFRALGLALPPR